MQTYKLHELAKTIRSKNAGVDALTFDIIFSDRERYEQVRDSGAITRESIARLFKISGDRITTFVAFEPALAIKFSIRRLVPAGGAGENDLFGCQQYAPLFDIDVPVEKNGAVSNRNTEKDYSARLQHATIRKHPKTKRLYQVSIGETATEKFFQRFTDVNAQRLDYIPYLRLVLAGAMREIAGADLADALNAILRDRASGGFTIDLPTARSQDDYVKWATAFTHLAGLPNFDAMSGNYYATFTVKDTDSSDSYLRQAYRRFTMHTDGTFVDEPTDWLLMMKMEETNAIGGFSRLLHLDDWEDCAKFRNHPCGTQKILYKAPPSKNVEQVVERPTFFDHEGKPCICFIDQFACPKNVEQARYLQDLSSSMEAARAVIELELPVGGLILLNNLFWLHGREAFEKNPKLNRVLMRQRGCFSPTLEKTPPRS
jgi:protein CsiD